MHGPESLPYRPGRAARKPSRDNDKGMSGSKIFQPTDSRQSGPEFGPAPRSTGGARGIGMDGRSGDIAGLRSEQFYNLRL